MNPWILRMNWTLVLFILCLSSFTPSEKVALGSAFLVLVGVIGEEVAELKFLKGEKRERTKEAIKRFAIGVLVLGLAGDLVGVVMGQAEMAALIKQAGEAATSASKASTAAGEAKTKADAADIAAGNAQTKSDAANQTAGQAKDKADAVGKKAEDLDRQLASANTQLAAVETKRAALEKALETMEICSAPRVIPGWVAGKQTNADPLRPFAGRHVTIEFVPDAEARRAALNLAGTLTEAGWKIDRVTGQDGIADGVMIQAYEAPFADRSLPLSANALEEKESATDADNAANALIKFLHSYFWEAIRMPPPWDHEGKLIDDPRIIPVGGLRIQVGLYPAVAFVSPPGDKALVEFMAQRHKKQEEDEQAIAKGDAEIDKRDKGTMEHLTPEQAAAIKAGREEWKSWFNKWVSERKQRREEDSRPCQAVSFSTLVNP